MKEYVPAAVIAYGKLTETTKPALIKACRELVIAFQGCENTLCDNSVAGWQKYLTRQVKGNSCKQVANEKAIDLACLILKRAYAGATKGEWTIPQWKNYLGLVEY